MRLFIFLILIMCFFISCNLRSKSNNLHVADAVIEPVEVQPKLDSALQWAVHKLVGSNLHLQYDIPLSESCITIRFISNADKGAYFSDSLVSVSYYTNDWRDLLPEYKGMLKIDNYNVAVFDINNIGNKYYNSDSLRFISLDNYKPILMPYVYVHSFYYKNGKLKYWNP